MSLFWAFHLSMCLALFVLTWWEASFKISWCHEATHTVINQVGYRSQNGKVIGKDIKKPESRRGLKSGAEMGTISGYNLDDCLQQNRW